MLSAKDVDVLLLILSVVVLLFDGGIGMLQALGFGVLDKIIAWDLVEHWGQKNLK